MSDVDDCGPCHDSNGLCPTHAEDHGYFTGRAEERAAVVAWLRLREQDRMHHLLPIADAIERGKHLKPGPTQDTRKG